VEAAPKITSLIRTAREVNDSQPGHVVELCKQYLGNLKGRRITALGLAYKADVDDLRESPAIHVCELLHQAGALVTAYEPFKNSFQHPSMKTAGTFADAVNKSEALLLLTAHEEFKKLVPSEVAMLTKTRIAIDCTGGWNRDKWGSAGFRYFRIGVGKGSQTNQNVKN
jgi:UDP-N-acetyl-D-mannosaminuronic acid dehydrogenase